MSRKTVDRQIRDAREKVVAASQHLSELEDRRATLVCPKCNGAGGKSSYDPGDFYSGNSSHEWEPCSVCTGSGLPPGGLVVDGAAVGPWQGDEERWGRIGDGWRQYYSGTRQLAARIKRGKPVVAYHPNGKKETLRKECLGDTCEGSGRRMCNQKIGTTCSRVRRQAATMKLIEWSGESA